MRETGKRNRIIPDPGIQGQHTGEPAQYSSFCYNVHKPEKKDPGCRDKVRGFLCSGRQRAGTIKGGFAMRAAIVPEDHTGPDPARFRRCSRTTISSTGTAAHCMRNMNAAAYRTFTV